MGRGKEARLVITGGGTGGHVYPALAVLQEMGGLLEQRGVVSAASLLYIGTSGSIEESIVRRQKLAFRGIASGPLRGKGLAQAPLSLGQMIWGFGQALRSLRQFGAQAVLATGGYVCVPVVLAARASGVPVLIYLPDVEPGWAIRFLARLANCVAVTSAASRRFLPGACVQETGYPVRPELGALDKVEARRKLGLLPDVPTLVVAGGSRGAAAINRAVSQDLPALLGIAQIVHVCGPPDEERLRRQKEALDADLRVRYHPYAYLHDGFTQALAAADLAVSRAGASVLGEYPAVGLPSVLVPYPYAGAHQRQNAEMLARQGAAVIVENDRLDRLLPVVRQLLGEPARLAVMAAAARGLARPGAARRIAELWLELAGFPGAGIE